MATRPVFITNASSPYYEEVNTEFQYYTGFAEIQKRRSVESLHTAFLNKYPNKHILEVSTRSENPLGQKLSAFNLRMKYNGAHLPVENIFQGGKVFENGGPYIDLFNASPYDAKKDERLKTSGSLIGFSFSGNPFPLEPKTFYYDWIYINALKQNTDLAAELIRYDAFTDIAFNPQRSLNCQARAVAVYVSLTSQNFLDNALKSSDDFRRIVYGFENEDGHPDDYEQLTIFDVEKI